jgi:uncharacterized peroxidase-related enzyme
MAFIEMIPEDTADKDLRLLYSGYRAPWGGVDNILKIHSLLPSTLKPHVDLYRQLMFGSGPLTRRHREMIAVVVSGVNGCTYCWHHHGDALLRVTKDRVLVDALRSDYRNAKLSPSDETMLSFAMSLTRDPGADHSSGVAALKDAGFSEQAILHVTLIVGYFNFVNRIAQGLGVELEAYWDSDGYSDPQKKMAHDPGESHHHEGKIRG